MSTPWWERPLHLEHEEWITPVRAGDRWTPRYYVTHRPEPPVCGLCGKPLTSTREHCVDHCHTHGIVRGSLCQSCNNREGAWAAFVHPMPLVQATLVAWRNRCPACLAEDAPDET